MDAATLTAWALVITAIGSFIASAGTVYNIHLARRQAAKLASIEKHTNGLVQKLGDAREEKGRAEALAER